MIDCKVIAEHFADKGFDCVPQLFEEGSLRSGREHVSADQCLELLGCFFLCCDDFVLSHVRHFLSQRVSLNQGSLLFFRQEQRKGKVEAFVISGHVAFVVILDYINYSHDTGGFVPVNAGATRIDRLAIHVRNAPRKRVNDYLLGLTFIGYGDSGCIARNDSYRSHLLREQGQDSVRHLPYLYGGLRGVSA